MRNNQPLVVLSEEFMILRLTTDDENNSLAWQGGVAWWLPFADDSTLHLCPSSR